ncbi:hypothetical protein PC129_g20981 [Phytophthora cactorum]|nr:hypothetical protein PC129_g20981 [Phytophthora cactorum]RAW37188.1 hypothetical protein PC110_g6554 [Phytophthora cactorum]
MNLRALATTLLTALVVCVTATVDYDKVEPFPQPEPATISENAVVKFKPQLHCSKLEYCVSYPTVNTAGEVTGGLKGASGNDACTRAPLGSQTYGRAGWYKDSCTLGTSPKAFIWVSLQDVMTGRTWPCGLTIPIWGRRRL